MSRRSRASSARSSSACTPKRLCGVGTELPWKWCRVTRMPCMPGAASSRLQQAGSSDPIPGRSTSAACSCALHYPWEPLLPELGPRRSDLARVGRIAAEPAPAASASFSTPAVRTFSCRSPFLARKPRASETASPTATSPIADTTAFIRSSKIWDDLNSYLIETLRALDVDPRGS